MFEKCREFVLFQQNGDSGNVDEGQKRSVEFVIASKHSAKPLEFLKEAFNQVPFFVGIPINRPRIGNIALGRNRIGGFLRINIVADRFCTVCLIAQNIAPLNVDLAEQGYGVLGIVVIAGTEQKSKRIAQAIHQSMYFCISAASGYADCLIFSFFPHRWRFDAPCRTLNQSRCSRSRRLWKGLGKPLQRLPYPAISENGCILSATGRIAPEVLATAPLLWQSTASHSVLYGYHILPGVRVSLLRGALAAAYP